MNSISFGPFLTIPNLYEPEFDEKIKDKILSFNLTSTTDGSLTEEMSLEGLQFPMVIDTEEFNAFKEQSINSFMKNNSKLIKYLEKKQVFFDINFGFYSIY